MFWQAGGPMRHFSTWRHIDDVIPLCLPFPLPFRRRGCSESKQFRLAMHNLPRILMASFGTNHNRWSGRCHNGRGILIQKAPCLLHSTESHTTGSYRTLSMATTKTTTTASSESFEVTDVLSDESAVAVVILFGWLGSSSRPLRKYANLYHDLKCATVATTGASSFDTMAGNRTAFRRVSAKAVEEAAELVRRHERRRHRNPHEAFSPVPVLIHAFSNGGCFVVRALDELAVQGDIDSSSDSNRCSDPVRSREDENDLALVSRRLQAVLYDSAPAYLHPYTGLDAVYHATPDQRLIRWMLYATVTLSGIVRQVLNLFVEEGPAERYWDSNLYAGRLCGHCPREAYVYSTADVITDADKLDELVALRKQSGPSLLSVSTLRFTDSPHVAHLRTHPQAYRKFVEDIVRLCQDGSSTS